MTTCVQEWRVGCDPESDGGSPARRVFPVECGAITNFDAMEHIWRHAFCAANVRSELRMPALGTWPRCILAARMSAGRRQADDELSCAAAGLGSSTCAGCSAERTPTHVQDQPVLLTDCPRNRRVDREKVAEYMFERFSVPALCIAQKPYLSLVAAGRTTGIVAQCGGGVTQALPVYEGFKVPHALQRLGYAGHDLTEDLVRILGFTNLAPLRERLDEARSIKETLCYVEKSILAPWEPQRYDCQRFKLPDGMMIQNELFRSASPPWQRADRASSCPACWRVRVPGSGGLLRISSHVVHACGTHVAAFRGPEEFFSPTRHAHLRAETRNNRYPRLW